MLPFHQSPLGAAFLLHRLTLRIIVVLVALLRVAVLPPTLLPMLPLLRHSTGTPVPLALLRSVIVAVSRSGPDLEFVQLVPFCVGSVAIRNREQFTNPTTHFNWLHFIHVVIMTHSSPLLQPFPLFPGF